MKIPLVLHYDGYKSFRNLIAAAAVFPCSRLFLPSGVADENCNLKLYHAAPEISSNRIQISFHKRHFVFLI